jgi:hypothetical protein
VATDRRRWFPAYTTLYREPWPRELKLALVMLGMHLTDRWASDGLTELQASRANLTLGDLLTITGCDSREESVEILRQLSGKISMKVTPLDNGFVRIEWPKFAKNLKVRRPVNAPLAPASRPVNAPSSSSSSPTEEEEDKNTRFARDAAEPASPIDPVEKPLRLLKQEAGSEEAKRLWLSHELPILLAESERKEPHDARARSAAFRSLIIRYWRQHERSPELRRVNGSAAAGHSTSDLAERARAIVRERNAVRATGADGSGRGG